MVNDEVTRFTFEDSDGMKVEDTWSIICTILMNHFDHGKIGAACCFLASSSTSTIEDVERLKKYEVPANVYNTVKNNLEVASTIRGAFTFCYRILMSGFGHDILDHDDCVSMISDGMQSFPENITIQLKGVKVLREYSLHKDTVDMMKKNAAIERLVDSLNVSNDEVNSIAFIALRNMCTNCEEVLVLDATSLPSVNDDICEAQMQKKVVDALNRCLLRELTSNVVMTNAMELIVCLSACSKPSVSLQIRNVLGNMVKYWNIMIKDLDKCVLLTNTFALLSVNSRFLSYMHSAGVTEAVFQELGLHEWNSEQLLVVIRLLAYITRNDEASRYVVMNGLERVMLELNKYVKSIQISRAGCLLIHSLCERPENHDALIAAKIITYYQTLMKEYPTDRTILMESLKILISFCATPSGITMLTSEHTTEAILSVLKANVENYDYEIVQMCTEVLKPFTEQQSVRSVVLASGIFTIIIPILPKLQ